MLNIPALKEFAESPNYRARIVREVAETQRQLAKEMGYSLDLRDDQRVGFLRAHIAKLEAVIA